MFSSWIGPTLFLLAAALWLAGLWLFLRADLSKRRKLGWSCLLVLVGAAAGVILALPQVWNKFLLAMAILPVLAAADLLLIRSRRGWSYWLRACGFEIGTVFGVAGGARCLLDLAGIRPIIEHWR